MLRDIAIVLLAWCAVSFALGAAWAALHVVPRRRRRRRRVRAVARGLQRDHRR
jgi:hypothetical protein